MTNQTRQLFPTAAEAAVDSEATRLPFQFIDLFCGIGGLRLGLEAVGGRCVFSCDYDKYAAKTYQHWYAEDSFGDVTQLSPNDVPDHDLLAAGFPCQPFSIAGVSKKNSLGRDHGFKDKTQGTLFFHLADLIDAKQPPVLLLENVKNLKSHDKGQTWKTIQGTLTELGYTVYDQIIDAIHYVPQHRERIFVVGFRKDVFGADPEFQFPVPPETPAPVLKDILQAPKEVDDKYVLSNKLWQYLQDYAEKHRQKGNGFGCSVASLDGTTRTLSARYHKDGSEILIPTKKGRNPRRLTPIEAGRLMGFPEHLIQKQVVSDTQAYRQYGNSVVPKVIQPIAQQIVQTMLLGLAHRNGNGCLLKPGTDRA